MGGFRRPERPIRARVSRALFPAGLLTLTVTAESVDGLVLVEHHLNGLLRAMSGGDPPLPHLRGGDSLDLYVAERGRLSALATSGVSSSLVLQIAPGEPLAVTVTWEVVDGVARSGRLAILWAYEAWIRGDSPRIYWGSDAATFEKYIRDGGAPVPSVLLHAGTAVKQLTKRDIRLRVAHESRGLAMNGNASQVHVDSLEVEGYRGFREKQRLKLARPDGRAPGSGLTIVVGANNAGKSTLWESFDAVGRKLRSDVSFSERRRNRNSANGIGITMTYVDGTAYTVRSQHANTSETRGEWAPSELPERARVEIIAVPSRRYFQTSFGKNLATERDWMSNGQDFSRNQQRDAFTGRLFALQADEVRRASFNELLAEVVGEPLEWSIDLAEGQFGSNYYLKVVTAQGVDHSSEGLGDGIVSLLFILDALHDSDQHSLIVIDEPELSLHPQFVRRLAGVIARFSASRQIVVFTHSPILVSWDEIEAGAEIARVHKEGPDSQISQVGRPVIDEVAKARGGWKNPHVLGSDANEALFLDDGVVVVEGQEDAGLLRTVFEQVDVPMTGTVFGWGAGGGDGGPRRIMALLDALGFKKVVALLDADKPGEVEAIRERFPNYLATTIPADDIRDKPDGVQRSKQGLLDERGKTIKKALVEPTREVLLSVSEYLKRDKN
ncbi:MAG: hypothetical protein DI534_12495 [Leifsonia xyli]|nr:MAG: hypothetical protein DI534_12495 [Leifsonia xyli]